MTAVKIGKRPIHAPGVRILRSRTICIINRFAECVTDLERGSGRKILVRSYPERVVKGLPITGREKQATGKRRVPGSGIGAAKFQFPRFRVFELVALRGEK